GPGRRKYQGGTEGGRPEVPIGDVGTPGPGKPDLSRRVDVSVREEAGQLIASDCVADIDVGPEVVAAERNDLCERDPFTPFRVGCCRGIAADIACHEGGIEIP